MNEQNNEKSNDVASSGGDQKRRSPLWRAALRIGGVAVVAIVAIGVCRAAIRPSVPKAFQETDKLPVIYPDYVETTFPPNIAPPNFRVEEEAERYLTKISTPSGKSVVVAGRDVIIPPKKWRKLTRECADSGGGDLTFAVYLRRDGEWTRFAEFKNSVSPDKIDPYVAYRLIEPGYEYAKRISLNQRSLETYREERFFDNRSIDGSPCVNCHSFQNRQTKKYLFHYRRTENPTKGGTVFVDNGKARKSTAKWAEAEVSCSYPAWRPTGDLVVFSANKTRQLFHSLSPQKIEVFDFYSDLTLYDAAKDELTPITRTDNEFETFPSWSPDGETLFYCRAKLTWPSGSDEKRSEKEVMGRVGDFRYDIMKMRFDESTRTFGPPETVVEASAEGRSALHPRVSPDGKWLVYTECECGTFPIWRPEADLILLNLATGERRRWTEANSDNVDSYHTWDSSGRWLVFSSRREDGQYTRLYLTHIDGAGRATKPFVLPQKNPLHNLRRMKSYNIPELISEPITESEWELTAAAASEATETKVK